MNSDNLHKEEPLNSSGKESIQNEEVKSEINSLEQDTVTPTETVETAPEDQLEEEVKSDVVEDSTVVDSEEETPEKESVNYNEFSKVELINALRKFVEETDVLKIREDVEAIKAVFYKKRTSEKQLELVAFLETGGEEADFKAEVDPYELDLKNLLKEYQRNRHENAKEIEQSKQANLQRKLAIIEEIKALTSREEAIGKTYADFKGLQQTWHEIGQVPQGEVRNLWETYHHYVEVFFDYVHINRELRDLDLKKNQEKKENFCELAEKLGTNEDIIDAFYRLQNLHEKWREVGPVPKDIREPLWDRFSAASIIINKKHQQYYENLRKEQAENVALKEALCVQAEEVSQQEYASSKEWRVAGEKLQELQKSWKEIGFIPRKDSNKLWARFRSANDHFFAQKREQWNKTVEISNQNYEKKLTLCVKAEALQDSEEWKSTTSKLIQIQKDWKAIGPVPRKQSDEIWNRFRKACDSFFDRKGKHFEKMIEGEVENLKLKEAIIVEVEAFEPTGQHSEDLTALKSFQDRFKEIGYVPLKKKDEIVANFRQALNAKYDMISMDEEAKNLLRFKMRIDEWAASNDGIDKIYHERDQLVKKYKQLESDKITASNNIGFFSGSKTNPLLKNLQNKIDGIDKQMAYVLKKVDQVDELFKDLKR